MSDGEAWHLRWHSGGLVRVLRTSGDAVVLLSTTPHPPGSRIEAEFVLAPTSTVKFKVHSSKRQPDGAFLIEGRSIDFTRGDRARLETLVANAST